MQDRIFEVLLASGFIAILGTILSFAIGFDAAYAGMFSLGLFVSAVYFWASDPATVLG